MQGVSLKGAHLANEVKQGEQAPVEFRQEAGSLALAYLTGIFAQGYIVPIVSWFSIDQCSHTQDIKKQLGHNSLATTDYYTEYCYKGQISMQSRWKRCFSSYSVRL